MSNDIDGEALARAPLTTLENTLNEFEAGSSLRTAFASVLRFVAVQLIAGAVPDGMNARESVRRGCDLLALLSEK